MGVFRVTDALLDGVGRLRRAPAILAAVWAVTALVSLPLTLAMRGAIAQHLDSSLEAEAAASGANYDWMQEFSGQASGLAAAFTPAVIGFGAVLDNLSAFIDRDSRPVLIISAAAVYLALWIFLAGGIIDRYARDRALRAHAFFSACGVFFFRFLRLGVVAALVYAALFGPAHSWLFNDLYTDLVRNVTSERTAFFARVGLYLVFGMVLAAFNLLFDYAKVRAVVEDRRSMLGAIWSAARFLRRNLAGAVSLYAVNTVLVAAVLALYAFVAPGAGSVGLSMWIGFAIGQLYVLARLAVKLLFWASETALFQSRLAHAGYVARPQPAWPESPSVEALQR